MMTRAVAFEAGLNRLLKKDFDAHFSSTSSVRGLSNLLQLDEEPSKLASGVATGDFFRSLLKVHRADTEPPTQGAESCRSPRSYQSTETPQTNIRDALVSCTSSHGVLRFRVEARRNGSTTGVQLSAA